MKERIDLFIELFTAITKQDSDIILGILDWDDETKLAFRIAKKIFEGELEEDEQS